MNPCCEKPENLSEPQATNRPDLVVRVCAVCGRRHFELTVDPLNLHIVGS